MVDLSIVMLNYQRVLKKNIVFCCVFPVRLSWLFVVFEKDFSGFGGDLWLVTFLPFAAFVAFGDFCFSASYLLVFVLFFFGFLFFWLGWFLGSMLILIFGVSMQFPAVQKYLDQKSEVDAKIHRVYGQVKTCPGTVEKIVDTFVNIYETYTKRLWHVAFVVNCIWALCELYVTSMWHVFETATYMRRLWDAIEMHVDIHKKYTYRGVGLHFQIRWKLHVCCKT